MFTFFTFIALQSLAHAGTPDDAAMLLSRFPSGGVPEVPAVMEAIKDLGQRGHSEDLPLLESLIAQESSAIGTAASLAAARITGGTIVAAAEPAERKEAETAAPRIPVSEER